MESDKTLRVIGFDDAPFERSSDNGKMGGSVEAEVGLAGVVCANARFEGMVWESVTEDGWDATETVIRSLRESKFADQVHAVLLDGIAFGGFNVVDVPKIAEALDVPCCTVMRTEPDWSAIRSALEHVSEGEARLERMRAAGRVIPVGEVYMQICGPATARLWRRALPTLTREGHIPEPVRMAHLIARAVVTGESGRRA